jgi:hypothetical protein
MRIFQHTIEQTSLDGGTDEHYCCLRGGSLRTAPYGVVSRIGPTGSAVPSMEEGNMTKSTGTTSFNGDPFDRRDDVSIRYIGQDL